MYWGFSQFDVEESSCPEPRARPHQHLQGEVMVNDGLAELFQTTPYITCQNHLLEHIHTLTAEAPHQQQYLLKRYCDMEPGSWNSDLQIPLYPLSYSDVATVRQDFSPDITNTPAADELVWNFWKTLAAHQWQVVWECLAIDLQRSIQLINSKKKKRERVKVLWFQHHVIIFWCVSSSMTVNWLSLHCGYFRLSSWDLGTCK